MTQFPQDAAIHSALAAAQELCETQAASWASLSLMGILQHAELSYADVFPRVRSKADLARCLFDHIDQLMLTGAEAFDAESSTKERLFDLLMARFDALQDMKALAVSLFRASQRSPLEGAALLHRLDASMQAVLNAAGEESSGLIGHARCKALAGIYLRCFQIWMNDDSEDLGATMKVLDEGLSHAEKAAQFLATRGKVWPKRHPEGDDSQATGQDESTSDAA